LEKIDHFAMALNSTITSYQIFLSSQLHNHGWEANIILMEKNNTPVIDLRFVADAVQWLSKGKINANGVSIIYLDIVRYSRFVDLLRNESPIVAVLYSPVGSVPPRVVLQTGAELTGENETL
jgi:hypothetical protein